jgi:hypothetical protein
MRGSTAVRDRNTPKHSRSRKRLHLEVVHREVGFILMFPLNRNGAGLLKRLTWNILKLCIERFGNLRNVFISENKTRVSKRLT